MSNLYEEQIDKYGLNVPENWKGDPRQLFIETFAPLLNKTEYSFKVNVTDSSAKILEVHFQNDPRRIIGLSGKRNMRINVFFNPEVYKVISQKVNLPGNQKAYRSQPHMEVSLETMWNVLCALTQKDSLMI